MFCNSPQCMKLICPECTGHREENHPRLFIDEAIKSCTYELNLLFLDYLYSYVELNFECWKPNYLLCQLNHYSSKFFWYMESQLHDSTTKILKKHYYFLVLVKVEYFIEKYSILRIGYFLELWTNITAGIFRLVFR